jgi:hypothetical protein
MLRQFVLIVFALAAGFTASGIVACLYRLVADSPLSKAGKAVHLAVMVVAGPNVLLRNASKSYRAKNCSGMVFWFVAVVAGYWSFALGLFVIQLGLSL